MTTEKLQICDFTATKDKKIDIQVETEISLPDYYAAINRVIKCKATVMINSKSVSDGQLSVGGYVNFNIIYSDKDNCLNNAFVSSPFSKSIDYEGDFAEEDIKVCSAVNYINCKPLGERKAQISATIGLNVILNVKEKTELISQINCDNYYTKSDECSVTSMCEKVCKNIYIEASIMPENAAETVRGLMRSDLSVRLTDCKVLGEKVIVKGDVIAQLLLFEKQSDKIRKETSVHSFSQIIDISNQYSDNALVFPTAEIQSYDISPIKGINEEISGFELQAKTSICVQIFENKNISFIKDAFSKLGSSVERKTAKVLCFAEKIEENYSCKKNFECTNSYVEKIIDSWVNYRITSSKVSGAEAIINGTFIVTCIAADDSGEPFCIEKNIDFEYKYRLSENIGQAIAISKIDIIGSECNLVGSNEIEFKIELKVLALIFAVKEIEYVSSAQDCDEAEPCSNSCVKILYGCENKKLWDVAKQCLADPQKICEINEIENLDCIEKDILLIPN